MEGIVKKWQDINFVFYASLIKWPVLIGLVVEILCRLLITRFLSDMSLAREDLLMWIVRLAIFIYVGYKIQQKYGQVPPMGALAGAEAGLFVGLALALFRFYDGFKVWKLFNVFTEAFLTALVGCLAAFLVVYIWDLLPKKR